MSRSRDFRSDLMTVEQVADYLQLNKLTIYKYIREGRLPAARLGKAYRIRLADVDAFLERHMSRPTGRPADRPAVPRRQEHTRRSAPRPEDVVVAPPTRSPQVPREYGEISIYPMEWVIRGLH